MSTHAERTPTKPTPETDPLPSMPEDCAKVIKEVVDVQTQHCCDSGLEGASTQDMGKKLRMKSRPEDGHGWVRKEKRQ